MYKRERLELPIRFRPLDAILLGFIAILLFWVAILSSELADVQKVHEIQREART